MCRLEGKRAGTVPAAGKLGWRARLEDGRLMCSFARPVCASLCGRVLRFLRARKFDVPKAKVMIISCEEWRAQFGVDDIVKYVRRVFSLSLVH